MNARTDNAVLLMGPELTIYSAAPVRAQLLDALSSTSALTLDLSQVCEIDSAGMQLLLAARRMASDTGATLVLASHTPAVLDALGLFGLDQQCGQGSAA